MRRKEARDTALSKWCIRILSIKAVDKFRSLLQ